MLLPHGDHGWTLHVYTVLLVLGLLLFKFLSVFFSEPFNSFHYNDFAPAATIFWPYFWGIRTCTFRGSLLSGMYNWNNLHYTGLNRNNTHCIADLQGWLVFPRFDFILDFLTFIHQANILFSQYFSSLYPGELLRS